MILIESEVPKGSAQIVVGEATACLPLGGSHRRRCGKGAPQKALGQGRRGHREAGRQARNEKFVANAKPEVVEAEREKLADLTGQNEKLAAAIERLGQAG
jgi:valyl-tRNA synthetase